MESLGHAFTLCRDFLWGFSPSQSFHQDSEDENEAVAFGDWASSLNECEANKPDEAELHKNIKPTLVLDFVCLSPNQD